jgi:hypothetical protein
MPAPKLRIRPGVERLDARVVMSAIAPSPTVAASATTAPTSTGLPASYRPVPGSQPSANPNRPFTPADLQAYAAAYLSAQGDPDFTPQFDFNGSGFIGQNDATPILRGLASITPKQPLKLLLYLAPGEQVQGHHPANSGGVTRDGTVTVVGKTTPNSIVFVDGPTTSTHAQSTGNFKFEGGALATNAQGFFYYTVKLADVSRGGSLLGVNFLVRTPFNQQLIRSFPILRLA